MRGTCLPSLAALRDRGVFGPEASLTSRSGRRRTARRVGGPARAAEPPLRPQPVQHEREIAPPGARRGAFDHQAGAGDAVEDEEHVLARSRRAGPRPLAWARASSSTSQLATAVERARCRSSRAKSSVPIASQKPRSAICVAVISSASSRNARLRVVALERGVGRRDRAARRRWASSAASRSSFVGKRRKIVADADAGALGDLVHARVDAVLGEDLARRIEDALEVALRRRRGAAWGRRASMRPASGGLASAPIDATCALADTRATITTMPARDQPGADEERELEAARSASGLRDARCDECVVCGSPRATRASRGRARRRPAATC